MTSIRILVGSVYGGALLTARTLKKELEGEGHHVTVLENPALDDIWYAHRQPDRASFRPICCPSTWT